MGLNESIHIDRLTSQSGSEREADDERSICSEGSRRPKRRRKSVSPVRKDKRRRTEDPEEDPLPCFDPAALVEAEEGTVKVPRAMQQYLEKHMKRCLTKEERDALFKEHPRPDLTSCVPPKIDKYMLDFLGKRLPKTGDSDLSKIQASILAVMRPMTSAWQQLVEGGLRDEPDLMVPAVEVLAMIQRIQCLLGNASELTSQTRRTRILEVVDPSWSRYGSEEFPSSSDTLFGEDFQEKLSKKVERDTALSKAISITKRAKKEDQPTSSRRVEHRKPQFFRRGPPARYEGRQGKNFLSYNAQLSNRQREHGQPGQPGPSSQPKQGQFPLYHEPRLPGKTPQKRF